MRPWRKHFKAAGPSSVRPANLAGAAGGDARPARKRALHLVAGGLLLVATAAGAVIADSPEPVTGASARARVTLLVDVRHRVRVRSQVGFLHGLAAATPPTRWIAPLRPALWRGTPESADVERAQRLGARYVLVVSDLWGYPGAGWYGRRPPWEDVEGWRALVAELADRFREQRIVWDIWNEPDVPYYWSGTREQYYDVYRIAAREIRARGGDRQTLAGPSTSSFAWSWLEGLIDYCASAGCEVNALTWHEFTGETSRIDQIAGRVHRARAELLEGDRAARVGLEEIHINETVSRHDGLAAGEQVAYLAALEAGGADAAARACWQDPCGLDTCASTTLDGLLDHRTGMPRAAWWTLKWYALGVSTRVAASSTTPSVAVLASTPRPGRIDVLAGYQDPHDRLVPDVVDLRIRVHGVHRLGMVGRAAVRVDAVGGVGEDAAVPRSCSVRRTAAVRGGAVEIAVDGVALHDAVRVRITRRGYAPRVGTVSAR